MVGQWYRWLGRGEIREFGNRRLGDDRNPPGEFDHPLVPDGSPLRRTIPYRLLRPVADAGAPGG
jgi:hypothetical protein